MSYHRIAKKPGRDGTHVYMVEHMANGRWVEVAGPYLAWEDAERYMKPLGSSTSADYAVAVTAGGTVRYVNTAGLSDKDMLAVMIELGSAPGLRHPFPGRELVQTLDVPSHVDLGSLHPLVQADLVHRGKCSVPPFGDFQLDLDMWVRLDLVLRRKWRRLDPGYYSALAFVDVGRDVVIMREGRSEGEADLHVELRDHRPEQVQSAVPVEAGEFIDPVEGIGLRARYGAIRLYLFDEIGRLAAKSFQPVRLFAEVLGAVDDRELKLVGVGRRVDTFLGNGERVEASVESSSEVVQPLAECNSDSRRHGAARRDSDDVVPLVVEPFREGVRLRLEIGAPDGAHLISSFSRTLDPNQGRVEQGRVIRTHASPSSVGVGTPSVGDGPVVEGAPAPSTTAAEQSAGPTDVQRAKRRVNRARDEYEAAITELAEARLRDAAVVAEQMATDRACADAQAAARHLVR